MRNDDMLARVVQGSVDLNADIDFFQKQGFRLDHIYPADDPRVAILWGHQLSLRLDRDVTEQPSLLHVLTDDESILADSKGELLAPNGCRIQFYRRTYRLGQPDTRHKLEIRKLKDGEPWVIGRAGMQYRDLLPDRLGGSIIASHIRIPKGGPVPDVVHYHTIGFQLIFCYRGWVKLVYEDQGPPFTIRAGECVTQPPEIRHQVLESSDHLEVVEIGVPADHMTTIDHHMELPTGRYLPNRRYQGQLFCRHLLESAKWEPSDWAGFQQRDSGVHQATGGKAAVTVRKCVDRNAGVLELKHEADILFTFVMMGSLQLSALNRMASSVNAGEAFVVPPHVNYQISKPSSDLELLEVSLPGTSERNR